MSGQSLGSFYAGDTLVIKFQLKKPTGAAENLTGATVRFGLSENDDIDKPFLTKTNGAGLTITDAAQGKGEVRLEKGDMKRVGTFTYAISATLSNGEKYTYEQGRGSFKEAMF